MLQPRFRLFCVLSVAFSFAVSHPGARADTVRLQIVGPDKKPVANAQIRVVESSGDWRNRKVEAPREL